MRAGLRRTLESSWSPSYTRRTLWLIPSFPPTFLQFKPEMLSKLYELAQFQYACGDYAGAADMLYHYRILVGYLSLAA